MLLQLSYWYLSYHVTLLLDFVSAAASQVPVTVGGVEIHPGDVIFGDDDGIVVLGSDLGKIQVNVFLKSNRARYAFIFI